MMFDWMIHKAIRECRIGVSPFDPRNIGPGSLDLTLSDQFLLVEAHKQGGIIKMDTPVAYVKCVEERFILAPKHFVLASTVEQVSLDATVSGAISGRSSIGRLGLFVENAGWIDPGFSGNITLELFNANDFPIELEAGRRICQMIFSEYTDERFPGTIYPGPLYRAKSPYTGKYQGEATAQGPVGSQAHQDREVLNRQSAD